MAIERMQPSKPHFFKPILSRFGHQMSIPASFLKYLKGQKFEKSVLRSPTGKLWHVKMNGMVFEDGWKEFAKAHDLHVGDFLVFRHEGNLIFNVMVFDPTTCLREYPSFDLKEEIETPQQETVKESAGEFTKKQKSVNNLVVPRCPYFVVNVTSYTAKSSKVHIPRKFARLHGLDDRFCKIVLVNQQGQSWLANLRHKKTDGQAYIGQGWSAFRNANNLKAGDSFILELIQKGKKPEIKMTRLKADRKTRKQPGHCVAKTGSSSIFRNLQFYATMKPFISIPRNIARRTGVTRDCSEMIIRNERGKSWIVSIGKSKSGVIRTGRGWMTFAKSNGLRKGDLLILELIKGGKKPVMKIVGVNEGAESSNHHREIVPKSSLEIHEDVKMEIV